MRFKPFTAKYDFSKAELIEDYPPYLREPIVSWIHNVIDRKDLGRSSGYRKTINSLHPLFIHRLNTIFRETFPYNFDSFIAKVFGDPGLTSNFLSLLLQNMCRGDEAVELEGILAEGGSAFAVEKTDKSADQYDEGVYELVKRVPEVVVAEANKALGTEPLIGEAWRACYSRNPDYEKAVGKCCDALEHLLRDKYDPSNTKPQLGRLLRNLQNSPEKLSFMGDTLLDDKIGLINLLSKATQVRGSHTAGTGRAPTPAEAKFVLHATILIWNLHNSV